MERGASSPPSPLHLNARLVNNASFARWRGEGGEDWYPCPSEPRVHGLAFEGEDGEDALVDAAEGLAAGEALQRLDPEGELAEGERAFGADRVVPRYEAFYREVLG